MDTFELKIEPDEVITDVDFKTDDFLELFNASSLHEIIHEEPLNEVCSNISALNCVGTDGCHWRHNGCMSITNDITSRIYHRTRMQLQPLYTNMPLPELGKDLIDWPEAGCYIAKPPEETDSKKHKKRNSLNLKK